MLPAKNARQCYGYDRGSPAAEAKALAVAMGTIADRLCFEQKRRNMGDAKDAMSKEQIFMRHQKKCYLTGPEGQKSEK